jgi:NTE family protein
VLRHLSERFPKLNPKIFTGISAGSINAAFLAQGQPFVISAPRLYSLWENIAFEQVFRTNFSSLFRMALNWLSDLFISKITQRHLLRSILDATPLSQTLLSHIHFWKIQQAIRRGAVRGLAFSATNYHTGNTTTFFDCTHEISPWHGERRNSERTALRVRHVMASCSIPLLFEPVPIGNALYGDGSLRFSFPFSPAIHLGAKKILAIGIRCAQPENAPPSQRPNQLSLGFVAGSVLNSIFLDSLEFDYENLQRINLVGGPSSPHFLDVKLVRPSRDLGSLAKDFIGEVPFHFRELLKATADPAELGDLLSYLMFSRGYVRALLELGKKDAEAQEAAWKIFFGLS